MLEFYLERFSHRCGMGGRAGQNELSLPIICGASTRHPAVLETLRVFKYSESGVKRTISTDVSWEINMALPILEILVLEKSLNIMSTFFPRGTIQRSSW